MTTIRIKAFSGLSPSKGEYLLQPGEATEAKNIYLSGGELQPQQANTTVLTGLPNSASATSTIFYNENPATWFSFPYIAHCVRAPLSGDLDGRVYITRGAVGVPCKTRSALLIGHVSGNTPSVLNMGLPAPDVSPVATVTGTATDPASAAETVIYCFTYVSTWGEEGPPSQSSSPVSWRVGQSIVVTSWPSGPTGAYDVNKIRLYRSVAGSSATKFQFHSEHSIGTSTLTDTTASANLGDVLQTKGWVAPPSNMAGLCIMANSFLAGFSGNTVCFSEPGYPYAWPLRYQIGLDADVVGMAPFDQSLLVSTKLSVYIITGTDPASVTSEKLSTHDICTNIRGIMSAFGGVVYTSKFGLIYFGPSGRQNLTGNRMTELDWKKYDPANSMLGEYNGAVYVINPTPDTYSTLLVEVGGEAKITELSLAGTPYNGPDGQLYLHVSNTIEKAHASSSLTTVTWTSGVFRLASETNMAVGRIEATAYPVSFTIWQGTTSYSTSVADNKPFRLPAGYTDNRIKLKVSVAASVKCIEVATSVGELAKDG